jgi:hypothetical protein
MSRPYSIKLTQYPVGVYGPSYRRRMGSGWYVITSGVTLDRYEIVQNEDSRIWETFLEGSTKPLALSGTLKQATAEAMATDMATVAYNRACRAGLLVMSD